MRFELVNKVILITGAAGGIGAACARAFHAAGARLVLTDMTQQSVDALAASLGGERVLALAFDVTDRAAGDAVVAAAVAQFGGLDIVFANAGIAADPPTTIAMMNERSFEKVIDVDLLGVWRAVRACLPQIIDRQGHVLVTASFYSYTNGIANAPYAMSKAGVEMFGRSLRAELAGTGATAGVLYPGWIATPLSKVGFGGNALVSAMLKRAFPWPYNRTVEPEVVAAAVVRGVQKRASRIIAPKRWVLLSLFRGIVAPVFDSILDRDKTIHQMTRQLEQQATKNSS